MSSLVHKVEEFCHWVVRDNYDVLKSWSIYNLNDSYFSLSL